MKSVPVAPHLQIEWTRPIPGADYATDIREDQSIRTDLRAARKVRPICLRPVTHATVS